MKKKKEQQQVTLARKIKISSKKHAYLATTKAGYLFLIRHLVPVEEDYKDWEVVYKRDTVKICNISYHISKQTFEAMMTLYYSLEENNKS